MVCRDVIKVCLPSKGLLDDEEVRKKRENFAAINPIGSAKNMQMVLSTSDLFYGETEGGDLGSLAARGVNELDRSIVRSELIVDLSAAGTDRWYPPAGKAAIATGNDAG